MDAENHWLPLTRVPRPRVSRLQVPRLRVSRLRVSLPRVSRPRVSRPESHVPESHVPESHVPESHVPESHVPESYVPESYVPESHVPEFHVPVLILVTARQNEEKYVEFFFSSSREKLKISLKPCTQEERLNFPFYIRDAWTDFSKIRRRPAISYRSSLISN